MAQLEPESRDEDQQEVSIFLRNIIVKLSLELDEVHAFQFLDTVKYQFQENPDVYQEFLDLMKDFKRGVIGTGGVVQHVSELFYGHPTLLQHFNIFLPQGYKIDILPGH